MFRDFFSAFADLFTARRSRLEVSGLLLTLAMLPVSELLVMRMFSHLILDGPERYRSDPDGVAVSAAVFFGAFALSRAIHHVVRLNRVRVFRRGFETSAVSRAGVRKDAQKEAWTWAAAFELSTAMVSLIQVAAFCGLFLWLDPWFGLTNIAVVAGVLALVAGIYGRQLRHQVLYLAEGGKPGATAVGDRVGKRVRDAELGAVVASLAMAASLTLVLYRTVRGGIGGADAIVLFLGLRMMFSQVGNLSASAMRFARVRARLGAGAKGVDDDDDFDDVADEVAEDRIDGTSDDGPPAVSPHRTRLVAQLVAAGQRGDDDQVREIGDRLRRGATFAERRAREAAEAFAELAAPVGGREPVHLSWHAKPFPGTVGNWVGPLLLRTLTDRPVRYVSPNAAGTEPHLVLSGSILGSVGPGAVVAGAGVLRHDAAPDPRATYLSVRGPLTAAALRRAGGPAVEAHGDPIALAARLAPVVPTGDGGLGFVRHVSQSDLRIDLADGIEEIGPSAARPDDVRRFLGRLAGHDGVITSDPGVAALCDALGVPCAPVAFAGDDRFVPVYADYARGVGLDQARLVEVSTDLAATRWDDVLAVRTVAGAVLDEIEANLRRAVELQIDRGPAVRPA